MRVILLPGIVLPAEAAYGALIDALEPEVEAVAKDLEVYATPEPPDEYGLELEVAGVLREADARGWGRFHLVGYSGGGAAALAFVAAHADRLASLALLEPAWAGTWDLSPAEQAVWLEQERLARSHPDSVPQVSHTARARSLVLGYCDGQRSVAQVQAGTVRSSSK